MRARPEQQDSLRLLPGVGSPAGNQEDAPADSKQAVITAAGCERQQPKGRRQARVATGIKRVSNERQKQAGRAGGKEKRHPQEDWQAREGSKHKRQQKASSLPVGECGGGLEPGANN